MSRRCNGMSTKSIERDQRSFFMAHGLEGAGIIVCGVCGTPLKLEMGALLCPFHDRRLWHRGSNPDQEA